MNITSGKLPFCLIPFLLSACGDESVDLRDYLLPQINNGKVLSISGQYIGNKDIFEDVVLFSEYNENSISEQQYNFWTDAQMKALDVKQKRIKGYIREVHYTLSDKKINVESVSGSARSKVSWSFPRQIVLDKAYKDHVTGTFSAPTPSNRTKSKFTDVYSRTELEKKDCLLHTRLEDYKLGNKNHEARTVFVYCKPYGLVQINMYKKSGGYDEYQKLRKVEEL